MPITSTSELSLARLGWSPFFAAAFAPLAAEGVVPARVSVEHRSVYGLLTADGEAWGEVAGRLRHAAEGHADLPAVGDWVAVRMRGGEERATIHAVLPRRTRFSRRRAGSEVEEQVVAANVDTVFVVTSLNRDFNPRRIERYLAMAWDSGAEPVVLLTKADLCADPAALLAEAEQVAYGVPVHLVSAADGRGVEAVRAYLGEGRTGVFLGSSGVGKSTLANRLLGAEVLATRQVREGDDKGRHTTTHRQLVVLSGGGLLLDTPGMRELQLWGGGEGVDAAFADVEALAAGCRFADCTHAAEPGCAVLRAVETGALEAERLESWRKLLREARHLALKADPRLRAEENRKTRWLHKTLRDHKE